MLYFLGKKRVNLSSDILDNKLVRRVKKYLSLGFSNKSGHNMYGRITVFRKGGGYTSKLRIVDYNRIICSSGIVVSREYDFRHSGTIGCICYYIGIMVYVLLPSGYVVGDS
jgi:large subunit ribosomal protein L2